MRRETRGSVLAEDSRKDMFLRRDRRGWCSDRTLNSGGGAGVGEAVLVTVGRPGGDPAPSPDHQVMAFKLRHAQDERLVHSWQHQELEIVIVANCQVERVCEADDDAVSHRMTIQGPDGEGSLQQVGGDEVPHSSKVHQS